MNRNSMVIRRIFVLFLVSCFLTSQVFMGNALLADDDDNDGEELGEGLAGTLGTLAIVTVAIGSIYILFRRTYVLSKYLIDPKEYPELSKEIKTLYRKLRQPLFSIHLFFNLLATLIALGHGFLLFKDEGAIIITGVIAAAAMVILSVSGIVIWRKFSPVWDYRQSRGLIRWVHRQWLFTAILVLFLGLHLLIFED